MSENVKVEINKLWSGVKRSQESSLSWLSQKSTTSVGLSKLHASINKKQEQRRS